MAVSADLPSKLSVSYVNRCRQSRLGGENVEMCPQETLVITCISPCTSCAGLLYVADDDAGCATTWNSATGNPLVTSQHLRAGIKAFDHACRISEVEGYRQLIDQGGIGR